eukprot:SAG22_NODE_3165_length_1887_cov_1.673378_2_plen_72_part_00
MRLSLLPAENHNTWVLVPARLLVACLQGARRMAGPSRSCWLAPSPRRYTPFPFMLTPLCVPILNTAVREES